MSGLERRRPVWRRPRLWLLGAGLAAGWIVLDARCASRAGHDAAVRELVLDFVEDVREGDAGACEWFAACTGPSTPCDADLVGRLRASLTSQTEPLHFESTSYSGYFDAVTVTFSPNLGAPSAIEFALERSGRSLRFRGWQLCAMRFSEGLVRGDETRRE